MKYIKKILSGKCIIVYIVMSILVGWWWYLRSVETNKIGLIYKTDHKLLLRECRKIISERREGKWEKERYDIYPKSGRSPGTEELPAIIFEIKPMYIWIDENSVLIAWRGFHPRYDIYAYAEDAKIWPGGKELIPGLIFCDEKFKDDAELEKYIESIKPKE